MRRTMLIAVGLILWAVGVVGSASAGPVVTLVSRKQFAQAIQQPPQRLQPVSPQLGGRGNKTQRRIFPPPPPGRSTTKPTVLYTTPIPPQPPPPPGQFQGMVAATGSRTNLFQVINGGYVYTYKMDPNLYGDFLDLQLFFPQVDSGGGSGIDTLGIALTDQNDNAKIWRFDSTRLLTGVSETFRFNVSDDAGAGGSTSFTMDPGFDITHVISIQVADQGTLTPSFPTPPAADPSFPPAPDTALWFGTGKFAVETPEADPALCLVVGIAGFLLFRGRRRKA